MTATADIPPETPLDHRLDLLGRGAVRMLAHLPGPVRRVRVEAGDVRVEVEWDAGPAARGSAASGDPVQDDGAQHGVPARNGGGPDAGPAWNDGGPNGGPAWNGAAREGGGAARGVSAAPRRGVAPHLVGAPSVGVFYRAEAPGAKSFVEVGDNVAKGAQLGIVEAMKLMIPVVADRNGRLAEILVADSTSVEFGQPLFELADPDS
ncbi:acetyl-CoA carboxylase biotin carboxyl carrier protein [Streptosporangium becharense]|uniref:Biotin carboxyl carrier protein of acetyl-CoA carboxylase n=1 Tax=Streptosporangium becharense TaxID=1816182 RepID=A0A7W9MJE9_9ACTN|nr:acetyl-CoA carboxylase biotin carboxyl carrier protein subunit [Streptosporangium becharense]MBB2910424.1 acetyl-CoA carboxylase biotin carboxyl carrier protein [Streptosporangium becharense]MBB5823167.1 acetyl-CoA carboxylase biotin carboxyl carrier protein [Streptosporangium becharense]